MVVPEKTRRVPPVFVQRRNESPQSYARFLYLSGKGGRASGAIRSERAQAWRELDDMLNQQRQLEDWLMRVGANEHVVPFDPENEPMESILEN